MVLAKNSHDLKNSKIKKHGFALGWSSQMHAFFSRFSHSTYPIWIFWVALRGVPLESSSADTQGCQFCCFQPSGTVCQLAAGWDSGKPDFHLALHLLQKVNSFSRGSQFRWTSDHGSMWCSLSVKAHWLHPAGFPDTQHREAHYLAVLWKECVAVLVEFG